MQTSQFRFMSMAVVAEHKPDGSPICQFMPYELFPLYDGELKSEVKPIIHKGVDKMGRSYQIGIKFDNCLKAEWLNFGGTHRATAPDLRRGERVMLMQFADEDKYWWVTLGKDDGYRRLETILWLFSDTIKKPTKKLTKLNSYWVEMSTKNKLITLKTVKENGEPYEYTFEFNTASGQVTLMDDIGTKITLVSGKDQIRMENKTGSFIDLKGGELSINATKSIDIKTPKLTITADNSTDLTTKKLSINGASMKHNGINVGSTHKHATAGMGPPSPPMP